MLYVHVIIEELHLSNPICQTFMCVKLFGAFFCFFLDLVFQTFQRCDPNNVKRDRKDRLGVCGQS